MAIIHMSALATASSNIIIQPNACTNKAHLPDLILTLTGTFKIISKHTTKVKIKSFRHAYIIYYQSTDAQVHV